MKIEFANNIINWWRTNKLSLILDKGSEPVKYRNVGFALCTVVLRLIYSDLPDLLQLGSECILRKEMMQWEQNLGHGGKRQKNTC